MDGAAVGEEVAGEEAGEDGEEEVGAEDGVDGEVTGGDSPDSVSLILFCLSLAIKSTVCFDGIIDWSK